MEYTYSNLYPDNLQSIYFNSDNNWLILATDLKDILVFIILIIFLKDL